MLSTLVFQILGALSACLSGMDEVNGPKSDTCNNNAAITIADCIAAIVIAAIAAKTMRQSSTKPLPLIPIGGNLLSRCVLETSTSYSH